MAAADRPTVREVAVYDSHTITVSRDAGSERNPFLKPHLWLEVHRPDGSRFAVPGFADDPHGRVWRARWMPTIAGPHHLRLSWDESDLGPEPAQTTRQRWAVPAGAAVVSELDVEAVDEGRPGLLKADGWNFVWSGTGRPFFWNATTAYLLAGLREDRAIQALDRLASYGINRIRVCLCPTRQPSGIRWNETSVAEREDFTFRYGPWPARNPESAAEPDYDTSVFDTAYWKKFERLVEAARQRGIIVQVLFFTDAQEPQNYPFDRNRAGDDPDEIRYFDYAVARLAAFSNVEWGISNEWALYRPDEWVEAMGAHLAARDPYGHLASVHGHGHFPFRKSPWCTHALFQVWDETGSYAWARKKREEQLEATPGQPKPQVNEEFGYEDHSAVWGEGRSADMRSAESRVRLAWEIAMAGAWSTNGESARDGVGGWINGLREGPSDLLEGLRRLRTVFESFDWWKTEPVDMVATGHAYCRAEPGNLYAVYIFGGGCSSVTLPDEGPWTVDRYSPQRDEWTRLKSSEPLIRDPWTGPGYVCPPPPYGETAVFLIRRG